MKSLEELAHDELSVLESKGLRRSPPILAPGHDARSQQGATIMVDGRELLSMSSNDYLGLGSDPALIDAWRAAAAHGIGAGASRLITGSTTIHRELEQRLATFCAMPDAMLFSSGYAANVGTIAALLGPEDIVFSDALNHASLIDGCRLSRAEVVVYPHRDMEALERLMSERRVTARRSLVVTDAIFSMEGVPASLPKLDELRRRYDSWLMVDEAHSLGVLGPHGSGLCAETATRPDLLMGTLGKSFGVSGAFIAAPEATVELLRNRARSYVFSTASPPPLATVVKRALELVVGGDSRRERLFAHARRLRAGLRELGYRVAGEDPIPIVPVLIGDPRQTVLASSELRERGVLAHPIRPPTVPEGTSRIRLVPTAAHSDDDVTQVIQAFSEIADRVSSCR